MAHKQKSGNECTRLFLRAAIQRFDEARFLVGNSYTKAAVYLGGYAVECALKALLLAHTPRKRHRETKATFRGNRAHNYEWLKDRLKKAGASVPSVVVQQLALVNWWSTDLRYEPGKLDLRRANEFLDSTEKILVWARESI
jgi:HEPN domain-containing protein